mmetsp:Transcript_4497/g.8765  ORF Transcript_4497/g.8765 Transcript_4497/m.8765 type:complete len:248 (+) Transcript_4497:236-979(+)
MIAPYLKALLTTVLVTAEWQVVSSFVPISAARYSFPLARESAGSDTGIPFTGALETIPSLASLPLIPYIDKDGLITKSGDAVDIDKSGTSCFAIYDDRKNVQYIGSTDHLHHMLKVMLARRPDKTYYYKTYHIAKPSRSKINLAIDFWLAEGDGTPPGNSGGEEEDLWEKPLDVKPKFTAQDLADIEELENQGHMSKDMAMKVVTWQFEEEKMEIMRSRGVKEDLHFDLSLKGVGVLDLKAEGNLKP